MKRKLQRLLPSLLVLILSGFAAWFSIDHAIGGLPLPILMYHHIAETGDDCVTISAAKLEEQLNYLTQAGYHTVSFGEVIDFVDNATPLPDKPVVLVFDDGYESNYQYLYPLLQKYNAKATICVIGAFVGKDHYKDTDSPMLPYFNWDEAREMVESGHIDIASHTYDMHQYAPLESGQARESATPFPYESVPEYLAAMTEDFQKNAALIEENLGYRVKVFAYPNGKYNIGGEYKLRELGVRVTLTTREAMNRIRTGRPDRLYLMKRYAINETVDLEGLQRRLDGKRKY